jgi:hypothetical protein
MLGFVVVVVSVADGMLHGDEKYLVVLRRHHGIVENQLIVDT